MAKRKKKNKDAAVNNGTAGAPVLDPDFTLQTVPSSVREDGEKNYFAMYYRMYRNDYIDQYLEAYRLLKDADAAFAKVDSGKTDKNDKK